MKHLSTSSYKKVFYTYVATIVILLVLPLNGTLALTNFYFGFRSDHIVHCCIFIPFIPLLYLGRFTNSSFRLVLYGVIFASFCEFLHLFIPYRQASIFDLLANYLGIITSFLFLKVAHYFRLIPIFIA